MTRSEKRKPAPRELRGWVVVYADGGISALIWETRTRAKRWGGDAENFRVERATLRLDPPRRKRT